MCKLENTNGARHVVRSSNIFYITSYATRGRTQSDRPFILYHSSMPEQIKVTATICKNILCDKKSASCSGMDV